MTPYGLFVEHMQSYSVLLVVILMLINVLALHV